MTTWYICGGPTLAARLSKTTESLFPGVRDGSPIDPGLFGRIGLFGFSVAMFSFYRGFGFLVHAAPESPDIAMQQFCLSGVNLELTTSKSML